MKEITEKESAQAKVWEELRRAEFRGPEETAVACEAVLKMLHDDPALTHDLETMRCLFWKRDYWDDKFKQVREFIADRWFADNLVAKACEVHAQCASVSESEIRNTNMVAHPAALLAVLAFKLSDPRWQREFHYSREIEELALEYIGWTHYTNDLIAELPAAFEEPFRQKLGALKGESKVGDWASAMMHRTKRLLEAEKKSKTIALQGGARNFLKLCLQRLEPRYSELSAKVLASVINICVDFEEDTKIAVAEFSRRLSDPNRVGEVVRVLCEITVRDFKDGKKFGNSSIRICPALQPIAKDLWEIVCSVEYWKDKDWIVSDAVHALATGGLLPEKVIPMLFYWSYEPNVCEDEKIAKSISQSAKHALGYYAALGFKVAVIG